MVQNATSFSESGEAAFESPPAAGIAAGRYRLIGWAVDTTGRRLIDEICHIAACTPTAHFSQYIMPYRDINPTFVRRHLIRVINSGRYRMLKDLRTNKYIKTKSAASALTDFILWLENNRGDAADGVILVYHEFRKSAPAMLLEALKQYSLLDRFKEIVKGFANGFDVSEAKCAKTMKSFTLRMMSKVLLNRDENLSNALDRARAAQQVLVHLGQGERADLETVQGSGDCTGEEGHLIEFVRPFTNPIEAEEDEIAKLKVLLKRQNTFKPVFGALMRSTRTERQHASRLRRLLAENDIDYDKLKSAYEGEAKEGLQKLLQAEVANAKEKELSDLLEILDCFFDPEKKPVQPKPRYFPRRQRYNSRSRKDKNGNRNSESSGNPPKDAEQAEEEQQKVDDEEQQQQQVEITIKQEPVAVAEVN